MSKEGKAYKVGVLVGALLLGLIAFAVVELIFYLYIWFQTNSKTNLTEFYSRNLRFIGHVLAFIVGVTVSIGGATSND